MLERVREQPEIADPHEPHRQQVQKEAPQELIHVQRHHPLLVVVLGIAPAERHAVIFERQQPVSANTPTGRKNRGEAETQRL